VGQATVASAGGDEPNIQKNKEVKGSAETRLSDRVGAWGESGIKKKKKNSHKGNLENRGKGRCNQLTEGGKVELPRSEHVGFEGRWRGGAPRLTKKGRGNSRI